MRDLPAPSETRIPELDGIRGLAVGLVLFDHYVAGSIIQGTSRLGDFLYKFQALGASGVDLFFVLSGFLIGGILMDHREANNYFKSFYIRRCCRILPPYLLALFSYLALKFLLKSHSLAPWFGELFLKGGLPFWANLTFTQNIVQNITHHYNPDWLNVNWSLAIEEQFYLVLPLALWLLRPATLVKAVLVLVSINPLMQLFLSIFYPKQYGVLLWILPIRADALFIGVICAHVFRREAFKNFISSGQKHLHVTFIVLLAGMIFMMPHYDDAGNEYERMLIFNLWIALFYANLIALAVTGKNEIISRVMRFKALRRLGTISYTVYLFHKPINGLLHGLLWGRDFRYRETKDILPTLAALVLVLLFAEVLWRCLEKPIVTWGHRFGYGSREVESRYKVPATV